MLNVHEQHHFYTRPGRMPVVHSPISDRPFQVMVVIVYIDLLSYIDRICGWDSI